MNSQKLVFSIDIGGTFIKLGYVDETGIISHEHEIPTSKSKEDIFDQIFEYFDETKSDKNIAAITFSVPGAIDTENLHINGEIAVKSLEQVHFGPIVAKYTNLPVYADNDANCAALAELWIGDLQDVRVGVLYVIGTGIGGAITYNGKLFTSSRAFAGEFGYQYIDGEYDVSTNCSARALQKNNVKHTEVHKEVKEMFSEFNTADELQIRQWCFENAKALFNITYILDPDKIIIAGGVTKSEKFENLLNEEFIKLLNERNKTFLKPEIKVSRFKNSANLLGAASIYFTK